MILLMSVILNHHVACWALTHQIFISSNYKILYPLYRCGFCKFIYMNSYFKKRNMIFFSSFEGLAFRPDSIYKKYNFPDLSPKKKKTATNQLYICVSALCMVRVSFGSNHGPAILLITLIHWALCYQLTCGRYSNLHVAPLQHRPDENKTAKWKAFHPVWAALKTRVWSETGEITNSRSSVTGSHRTDLRH